MPPHWNAYVTVADVDASAKLAQSLGGKVLAPPFDVMDAGRMAVIQDPTGAVFCLWKAGKSIGAKITNEPGTICWTELATRDTKAAEAFYTKLFGWTAKVGGAGTPMEYTEFSNQGKPGVGMMSMPEMVPAHVPVVLADVFPGRRRGRERGQGQVTRREHCGTADGHSQHRTLLGGWRSARCDVRDLHAESSVGAVMFFKKPSTIPSAADALPGRSDRMPVPEAHFVNKNRLTPPFPDGLAEALFGMGCFWGAEKGFWQLPGVYSTAVGYAGGPTPNPTYREVCTGMTGHNEVVLVVFDPKVDHLRRVAEAFLGESRPDARHASGR